MNLRILMAGILGLVLVFRGALGEQRVGNTEWKATMQSLLADVITLFPYAFDEAKFNDPANAPTIQKSMNSLAEHSSGLKKHTSVFKTSDGLKIDPSFPFIAEAFESEIISAQTAFREGKTSYPRAQLDLRSAISKCMLCHTQSANGPELKLDQFKNQLAALTSTDKFMALAATRQFDEALDEFAKILRDSKIRKTDQSTIDRQARTALAIAVRVKKDPKRSLMLVDQITEAGSGSAVLQSDLKGWKKSILAWQAEKDVSQSSDQTLFSEATRLVEAGQKKENSLENYENSNVSLLRASADLHELLSNYPKSNLRAKSYLLLAKTYELLPGFAMWDLSAEYLGACIQENPHSEIGEKCYSDYKDSIMFGYSGSSGTHIPWAVSQHLEKMRELAKRSKEKKATETRQK